MKLAAWEEAYHNRFSSAKFGDDSIGLFALGLQFGIDDLDALGAEIVTGSGGDKKCDWPAPGSEDTELGVLMELEVGHGETEVFARVQA